MQNYSVLTALRALDAKEKAAAIIANKAAAAAAIKKAADAKKESRRRFFQDAFFGTLAALMMIIFFFFLWMLFGYDFSCKTYAQKSVLWFVAYFGAISTPLLAAALFSKTSL